MRFPQNRDIVHDAQSVLVFFGLRGQVEVKHAFRKMAPFGEEQAQRLPASCHKYMLLSRKIVFGAKNCSFFSCTNGAKIYMYANNNTTTFPPKQPLEQKNNT